MKKILLILILFIIPINTKASIYIAETDVNIRTGPSTLYDVVGLVYEYTSVNVLETLSDDSSNNNCPTKKWYKIEYGNEVGYVCNNWFRLQEITNNSQEDSMYDYEKEIEKFPDTYKKSIDFLHSIHPNWQIFAKNVDRDFNQIVDALSESPISLIQVSKYSNGYGYLWQDPSVFDYKTNKYRCYDGCSGFTNYGWFIPNSETIAYYLDPRNYLNESNIFAFLKQSFSKEETKEVLQNLVKGTFLSGNYVFRLNDEDITKSYVETFYEAGEKYNISSIMLLTRSKQEILVGDYNNDGLRDGSESVTGNVSGYEGIYNFFNYGAGSGANNIENALKYAKANDWTSPYNAILGGASKLVDGYISNNQHSLYLQKFNVLNGVWTHQYMQNIQAPKSESYSSFLTYYEGDMIDTPFVFEIPVFNNMPDQTELPNEESPNNYLKNITIDGIDLKDFDSLKYEYNYQIEFNVTEIEINAYQYIANGNIKGLGKITIDKDEKTKQLLIESKAPNNDVRTYKINIERKEKPEDIVYPTIEEILENTGFKYNESYISGINLNVTIDKVLEILQSKSKYIELTYDKNSKNTTNFIATNDKIIIKSGDNTYTFDVVLLGDIDGNAYIDLKDLLQLQKILLNKHNLSNTSLKSADINLDGDITLLDLLKIQKHLLGIPIQQ